MKKTHDEACDGARNDHEEETGYTVDDLEEALHAVGIVVHDELPEPWT